MKQIRITYTKKAYDELSNPDKITAHVKVFENRLSSWLEILKLIRDHDIKYFTYQEEDIPEQKPL